MGQVYLARSVAGRPIAIKTVHTDSRTSDDARRRFAREVSLAQRVNGAYTAVVIDADPDADVPWMATEYIAAPSLAELVASCGTLAEDGVRWIAAGAAEALAALHAQRIVHRDLKPSNILLPVGGPRLIDFGISQNADLTRTAVTLGTVAFAAPEQARGERSSPASDVYALGSTLFHLAVGRPPYVAGDPFQLLARVARAELDLTGLPEGLRRLVGPCLRLDPAQRPSPAGLVAGFGEQLAAHPRAAGGEDWLPRSWLAVIREHERRGWELPDAGTEKSDGPQAGTDDPAGGGGRTTSRPARPPRPATAVGEGEHDRLVNPAPAGPRSLERPPHRAFPWWRAALGAAAVLVMSLLLIPGPEANHSSTPPARSETAEPLSATAPPEEKARRFMDSLRAGDCLDGYYRGGKWFPETGFARRVGCDSPRAATRVTAITTDAKERCPQEDDSDFWGPLDVDWSHQRSEKRSACIDRVFKVGDCFPARDYVGGKGDQGLSVSLTRSRTADTASKWPCDEDPSLVYDEVLRVTAVHTASAGREACGPADAWLAEQKKRMICTRVVRS
jgi:hypothetical protein